MEGELQQDHKKRITDALQMHTPCGGKVGGPSRHPQTSHEGKGSNTGKGKTSKTNKDLGAIPKNQTQTQLDDFLDKISLTQTSTAQKE